MPTFAYKKLTLSNVLFNDAVYCNCLCRR